jgi:ribonuclease T1
LHQAKVPAQAHRIDVKRFLALAASLLIALFATTSPAAREAPAVAADRFSTVAAAELPKEARETLRLIRKGGPFPYSRDGVVFGNREKQLPARSRGYYHEYTVKTPGARNRGARRIVCGGEMRTDCYYSDDHYVSFRRILP